MRPLRLILLLTVALAAGCTGTPPPESPTSTAPSVVAPTPAPTGPEILADLLKRPVTAKQLGAGEKCPQSPVTDHSPVVQEADARGLGTAPIYPISFYASTGVLQLPETTPGPDGMYEIKIVWASSDDYEGLVVVRMVRLDGPGRAYMKPYYEIDLADGDATAFVVPARPADFPAGTFVSGPGCYAYQVDGTTFSELIYLRFAK